MSCSPISLDRSLARPSTQKAASVSVATPSKSNPKLVFCYHKYTYRERILVKNNCPNTRKLFTKFLLLKSVSSGFTAVVALVTRGSTSLKSQLMKRKGKMPFFFVLNHTISRILSSYISSTAQKHYYIIIEVPFRRRWHDS